MSIFFFIQNKKDKKILSRFWTHLGSKGVRKLSNALLIINNLIWHHKYNKKIIFKKSTKEKHLFGRVFVIQLTKIIVLNKKIKNL